MSVIGMRHPVTSCPSFKSLSICWITKDIETGINNIGTYNGYVLGPLRSSMQTFHGHILEHWKKCRHKGVPLQAAAVIGPVPAVCMVSVTRVPQGSDEMAIAGGIAGEPIEVVKCETIDVEVPASSEIVLEGEIPTDYKEPDPACGENTGYMIINESVYAFKIKCITHRKNPIWHNIISQFPPSESNVLRGVGVEGLMMSFLINSCGIPQVKEVAFHYCGGGWRLCVVRIQDIGGVRTHNSTVWQALTATLSLSVDYPKIVVAVDNDIDPWDLDSVFWAVSSRYMPHRDTKIIQGRSATLDQSSAPYTLDTEQMRYPTSLGGPQGASAILMDATRKWDYTPLALPKRQYMERAREIWYELGFPPLQPREPWFGRPLGLWPEQYQRQAELAEKGEFDQVAQELMSGGEKI